jgi:sugar/nucleoside kinase (ribokinase family)
VPGKKMVIVGEMNCDLFYKNVFFKMLEDKITEKVHGEIMKGSSLQADDIKRVVHGAISDLPKKIPGEAFIKRGGNGNNSTELFGKLGVPIKFITVTGTGSEWMKNELTAMGVDTSCIFQVPKTQPISAIIEDPTTTKIFTAANLKKEMNFSTVKLKQSDLADATIAFFTPMAEKFEPVLSTLQSMNAGILTAITIEVQGIDKLDTLQRVVRSKVDVIFINKSDAITITGTKSVEEADKVLARFARIRFITRGSEGSLICSDLCEPVTLPVFQVKVVDRTGAGDAFAAGVMLKCHELVEARGNLVKQLESESKQSRKTILKDLGVFGTAVASLKVSLARTPTRDEVRDFLSKNVLLSAIP